MPRYNAGTSSASRLPPAWISPSPDHARRFNDLVPADIVAQVAAAHAITPDLACAETAGPVADDLRRHWPRYALGTDTLGRSLAARLLAGGGISLVVGLAAATISVLIGTLYGALAGFLGGRTDAVLMRIVDVLYGLPYVLLVVLLAIAGDAIVEEYVSRQRARTQWAAEQSVAPGERRTANEISAAAFSEFPPRQLSESSRTAIDLTVLLIAIGGTSWLTMSRVIRAEVLSLKARPFVESARAISLPPWRIFLRHMLPNLAGPIIVYATLTVPQAMLQESFLSFLGIGVKPPLPSWGRLAADGLEELNPFQSNWWLLVFPCGLLATTLLALNFVGEGLREAMDLRRR